MSPYFLVGLPELTANIVDGSQDNFTGEQMQRWITQRKRSGQQFVLS
jgi:hypothetical protein